MSERFLIILSIGLLGIGCLFFSGQIFLALFGISIRPMPWQLYELLEIISAVSLGVGVIVGLVLLRRVRRDRQRAEIALRNAAGSFSDAMQHRFTEWSLSMAEQDVALFILKGSSIAEIAEMRNTAEGTIKAQNAAIYRKAGVSGKSQLMSLFIEDLFIENDS